MIFYYQNKVVKKMIGNNKRYNYIEVIKSMRYIKKS